MPVFGERRQRRDLIPNILFEDSVYMAPQTIGVDAASIARVSEPTMFASLRRWAHGTFAPGELPLEWTMKTIDEAGVSVGMLCAWRDPREPLISNDMVAESVRQAPNGS